MLLPAFWLALPFFLFWDTCPKNLMFLFRKLPKQVKPKHFFYLLYKNSCMYAG